jgi:hypothetical protein
MGAKGGGGGRSETSTVATPRRLSNWWLTFVIHFIGCLFREFSSFWLEQKPASVMEFNRIREEFRENIICTLQNPAAVLAVDDPCAKTDIGSTSVQSFTSQDFD